MIELRAETFQLLIVAAPILAMLAVAIMFLSVLRRRDGEFEMVELGVFYGGVIFLYSVYPLVAFISGDLRFSRFADSRLLLSQPSPTETATVGWYFVAYFVAFLAAYVLVRGTCRIEKIRIPRPDVRTLLALVALYAGVKGFFVFLKLYCDIRNPETYVDSYLLYANLPLIIQQLVNHLRGIDLTLQIILMAYLTFNFQKHKYSILGWIVLELLGLWAYGIGTRTGLFVLIASLLITYHFAVKPFKARSAAILGLAAIVLFVLLGVLRDQPMLYADSPKNPLAYDSEFDSLFATSYDLLYVKGNNGSSSLTWTFYVSDFLNLVPQQFLPIQKVDPTRWYLETYYPAYAASGGGLAFGAIPEAIVGLGWIDAACRGALIGILFALIHRNFVTGRKSFWKYCFYLWMIALSYQCFRATTFRLVPEFFYEFLSVILAMNLILRVLPLGRKIKLRMRSQWGLVQP